MILVSSSLLLLGCQAVDGEKKPSRTAGENGLQQTTQDLGRSTDQRVDCDRLHAAASTGPATGVGTPQRLSNDSYDLETVEGGALPIELRSDLLLVGQTVSLYSNGTYHSRKRFRVLRRGLWESADTHFDGRFLRKGEFLVFSGHGLCRTVRAFKDGTGFWGAAIPAAGGIMTEPSNYVYRRSTSAP
ncbi:MAG TPA: hypothetical protein VNJ04_00190 [Gemmatimonadaceae bacterium]|nr:hypothetical protein [Gemmatimonadaceae bacterium]